MRIAIDLPDTHIRALAALCERTGQPRAALVRTAITDYLARHQRPDAADAFGLWGNADQDGLACQENLRADW